MSKNSKIYVAGHTGLVGSSIVRCLKRNGYKKIITRTHNELDLTNQAEVDNFFNLEKPEYVIIAAAKVGGIKANYTNPAEFIYNNLMIEANIIKAAHDIGVKKLLFLGSTCIYPKNAPQPIKEESLLTGSLEKTNEAYAIAKIAGIKLCSTFKQQYNDNFISCMPTNLYGPNDNFDYETSHVLPAMIRKIHDAKKNKAPEVILWGTGTPLREFLHVDDLADACIFLMNNYNDIQHINIGSGEEISIKNLAVLIKDIVGYAGNIVFDKNMPDGVTRKLSDTTKINQLGWKSKISLKDGIMTTYKWFLINERNEKS